jgi:tetraacyldisaccharide 4'-kinase
MKSTPSFWYQRSIKGYAIMTVLWPLSILWRLGSYYRRLWITPARMNIPVICVGNVTAGGTGKTPLVRRLADMAIASGLSPVILSKGYGGKETGPMIVNADSTADMVGDEPLELTDICPVVIAKNRKAGATWIAENMAADVIIMDDGFQNPAIRADIGILVFDGARGIGNGQIIPVGPLREPWRDGLHRASHVIIIGEDAQGLSQAIKQIRPDIPIISAHKRFDQTTKPVLSGDPLVAFAGIGHPEAFFSMITEHGGQIVKTLAYPDHHQYTATDWDNIYKTASQSGAKLITTKKDYMRLHPAQRQHVTPLPLMLDIDTAWINDIYDELCHD